MKKLRTFLLSAMLLYIVSSYAQTPNNILQTSSWYTNTGSVGSVGYFTANGGSGQNSIIWGVDPFNKKSLLWQSISDGNNGPNGGWNCYNLPIDHTKAYRLTAWFKKGTAPTTGNFYFGCDGNGNTLNLDNTTNYNPYFGAYGNNNFTAGKWYLWVGYIHASSDGDNNSYGGIYDGETGQKLFDLTDYKMAVGAIYQMHRAYNFYDQQVGATAYWYAPRFEEINGAEPSIEQLLGVIGQPVTKGTPAIFNSAVGIGTTVTTTSGPKLQIDNGSTRNGISIISDGNENAYSDINFAVKNTDNLSAVPINWDISHRKDGFFTGVPGASSLEFYANLKGGGYYAPLCFKPNGDVILVSPNNTNLSGNVSIGATDSKGYKLAVNGAAIFTKAVVKNYNNWPDYVFDSSYQLRSLDSVSTFIQANKHLPDMPSAATVEKDGHDLGEVQKLLLKKVEEMTLYMIELKKNIIDLAEKNKNLEKEIKQLQKE